MGIDKTQGNFIWDEGKESANVDKHGVDFATAALAFRDVNRKIYIDSKHRDQEERYFCIGKVGNRILTVRFIYRASKIRIFGAGFWRKGDKYYEKKDA